MAEESLNLSLDDIIKRNAEQSTKRSPNTTGAKRGGRGGRGGRGSSFQPKGVQSRVVKTIRGRGQGRGASRGASRGDRSSYLRDAPRDLDALEGNKPWGHEGHTEVASAPRRNVQQRPVGVASDGTKLEVSNLDRNVTDNDIKELFQVCGDLKRFGVRYNPDGQSRGTAFVQFVTADDARKAFGQYNDIALDGKPMRIEFDKGTNRTLSSGIQIGTNRSRNAPAPAGALIQYPGTFHAAAAGARMGVGRQPGMRSMRSTLAANRMDED